MNGDFAGRAAVVTGAAGGIGLAVAEALMAQGAQVLGLDISEAVVTASRHPSWTGIATDVTDADAVHQAVTHFQQGAPRIDLLVSNAGIFTAGKYIVELDVDTFERSLKVNLTSHLIVLKETLLAMGKGTGSVVVIGSRNVAAPGPGAAAYSAAKAGLTQLARVAALELAPQGIRVNVVHPDAVFSTGLWTDEALASSARRYGLTVEEYKRNNLLKVDVRLDDVTNAVLALLSDRFSRTTGAQVPVDGGNIRVV
ncbi:MAG: SDR family oxidoreductase [Janthinobacterium lividum]